MKVAESHWVWEQWREEINTVGLRDWLWFVGALERDRFHWRLDIDGGDYTWSVTRTRRDRANRIDNMLDELGWETPMKKSVNVIPRWRRSLRRWLAHWLFKL